MGPLGQAGAPAGARAPRALALFSLGALALVASLFGCSRSGEHAPLTLALAILPGELPAYRDVVAAYERESGERVVVVPQQYADIRRALAAEAAAGRGTIDLAELDVYSLAPSAPHVLPIGAAHDAPAAIDADHADDADDTSGLADLTPALEPAAVAAGSFDGELRFLPHRLTWQALVYDHARLGAPPRTWDELVAVAREHPGRIGLKASRYEGLTCDLLPFVWAAGGSGERLDDPGALAAFRLFAELAPYLSRQSATFKEATIAEAAARGDVLLHLNWPFAMSLYASQGLAPEPMRSAAIPAGPAGRATVLGGGYLGIPRNARDPERSIALLRFLLSREVQAELGRRLGWFSARRDASVPGGEILAGYVAMRDEVRPRPAVARYPSLSRAWQSAFRAVVFDGADPERTLREAQAALDAAGGGA